MTGRPRLPVNTTGKVRVRKVDGKWQAIANHRDPDGRVRQYERSADTKTAAENALRAYLATKTAEGRGRINTRTTMADLAEEYFTRLAGLVEAGDRSPGTLRLYQGYWDNHGQRGLGALSVAECDVQCLDAYLAELRSKAGPHIAKKMRAVLSGMLGIAARYKAIPANPVRDVSPIPGGQAKPVRALEPGEVVDLLAKLTTLSKMPGETVWAQHRVYTPTRIPDYIPDLALFMLGTSLRIGQALAVHWPWIDFEQATVQVGPNIIRVKGEGLRLNEGTSKTQESVLDLPESVLAMLLIRREQAVNPLGTVFAEPKGGFRDPHNTLGDLRRALDMAGYSWVTSHTFRKTVATVLDDAGLSARAIADQLSHSRPSMTQDVYMARKARNPRAVAAIEAMLATAPQRKVIALDN